MERKQTLAILAVALSFILLLGCVGSGKNQLSLPKLPGQNPPPQPIQGAPASSGMKTFSSWGELSDFLNAASPSAGFYGGIRRNSAMDSSGITKSGMPAPQAAESGGTVDYSQTNVQVEGVDEADIVKNDGKYIYVVGNEYSNYGVGPFSFSDNTGKVTIIDAYPAAGMKKAGEIRFEGNAQQIFVHKDMLVVFGSRYQTIPSPRMGIADCLRCIMPPYYSQDFTFMNVYDITDRSSPKLEKEIEVKGNYVSSRLIGGKVYGVFSDPAYSNDPVPMYAVDGVAQKIAPTDISFIDIRDSSYQFTMLLGLDLDNLAKEEQKSIVLMGYAQNLFVSAENMYLTYTTYDQYYPEWQAFSSVYGAYLPEEAKQKIAAIDASEVSGWRKDSLKMAAAGEYAQQMAKGMSASMAEELQKSYYDKLSALQQERARQAEKTAIHKFALSDFSQLAKGEVPGHVLNQFSMDESGEYFRIATTVPQVWNWNGQDALPSSNNLYVLDSKLAVAGKVEDIAPGEQIYSVRFMGSRAYMVTYRQVDPFFVVDLSNPSSPKILGNLKIPGFSNYLHPYDERYIIGVGKETQETKEGQSLVQGVKLSLFDVQDPSTPREVAKVQIGDRGSDSFALTDHKAFLFSKGKGGLLVLPILEAKIDPTKYAGGQFPQWQYGDYVFQGAYVFSLSPENGFQLRGKITHATEEELLKSGQYYWSAANVQRSLYMGSTLYTVSDRFVKANDLESLAAISSVKIAQDPPQGSGYLGPAMPVAKPMAAQSPPENGG